MICTGMQLCLKGTKQVFLFVHHFLICACFPVVSAAAVCSHCQAKSGVKRPLTNTDMEFEAEMESLRKWGAPDGTSYSEDILRQLDQVAEPPETTDGIITSRAHGEQICPMCGKIYSHDISFRTFHQHVSDHFVEEEPVSSVLNNFEIIM